MMRFNGYDDCEEYRYTEGTFTVGKEYELVNGTVLVYGYTENIPDATFIDNRGVKLNQNLNRFTYIKKGANNE